ncbi:intradiol ring-cleavage dioxygenase [Azospirillum sp. A29]|jgi:hydroxyquinol 1,2-dioxygenase|uniref:intradiol ring-cleavage dioxygenase n=1 Tax=Azospirillum sp. A29 TaxID=3160606 RepID=UPI00366A65E5
MLDTREDAITRTVLDRMQTTADPRLRRISEAVVRHLHALVREIEPTQEEWRAAIDFLTRTGQLCSDTRQEFILLSDALGVSMLVDAVNHRHPQGATDTTVLGPFYVEGPPPFENGADLSGGMSGLPMLIHGSVATADGRPLVGAVIDIWHADDQGFYDVQQQPDMRAGRGRLRTDADGRFRCWSVRPVPYPIPHDGTVGAMLELQGRHPYRPAHVHFMIAAPGFEPLVTHLFVSGDPYLTSDVVFGVKESIIVDLIEHPAGRAPDGRMVATSFAEMSYDFRLAPARIRQPA